MFQFIMRHADPDVAKEDATMHKALSVERRMAVALWRLATAGYTCRSTALKFDIGRATTLKAKQELSNKLA